MQTLYGRKVQISSASPRLQCSPDFKRLQSPELVAETNAWMRDFFGVEETIPDGVVYEIMGDTLAMNQATYNRVHEAIAAQNKAEGRPS